MVKLQGEEVVLLNSPLGSPPAPALSMRKSIRDGEFLISKLVHVENATFLRGKNYDGKQVLGVGALIPGTRWYLVVQTDADELLSPIRQAAGVSFVTILAMIAILLVTVRLVWRARQAEYAATQSAIDARYLAARESSIDGYIVFDATGRIMEVNAAMARISGFTVNELKEKSITNWDMEGLRAGSTIAEIREKRSARLRLQWRSKDQAQLDLEASASCLSGPAGETFHAFLHDIGPILAATRRIEQLNSIYHFLSQANVAIFNAASIDDMLREVCLTAVELGNFALVWAGTVDKTAGRVVVKDAEGRAANYARQLVITTDPGLITSHGPVGACLIRNSAIVVNDAELEPNLQAWRALIREFNLRSLVVVPVSVGTETIAVVSFYSEVMNYFDPEITLALEEVGRNVALAWQTRVAQIEKEAAAKAKAVSEERYLRIFDSSPIPIMILSLSSRKVLSVNSAHRNAYGYSLEELTDEAGVFERFFANVDGRTALRDKWQQNLEKAISVDAALPLPELSLLCKDGGERIASGFLRVVGDDVIVLWLDLTDIRRAEAALIERERHFRSMIEQTLTGIFVLQGNVIVYANPRLCEITGWPPDEVIGSHWQKILDGIPANVDQFSQGVRQLNEGMQSIALNLPATRRDGKEIVLGMHFSHGYWDKGNAFIVFCQDITERLRAEKDIAAYVKQLEGAMRGTMEVVAKMVELRDPYTAGHEHRVGMIAADIAREMGWDETRCEHLYLSGLVHDIGKIGVPAEILVKPTRLSTLEYQIIQTHAEAGYEILKNVDLPIPIADIIREHHERMDGSGYPRGLRGDEIPVGGRLMAVVDVYDAVVTRAGELAAGWWLADLSRVRRASVARRGYTVTSRRCGARSSSL